MALQIEQLQIPGYEQVVTFRAEDFCCYIALHSTKLGPALGGCRVKPYSSEAEVLRDALRLSKAMSYKSSLAGLNFGGGKCCVMADTVTPEIMRQVGEAVNFFQGRYITAEDVGTSLADTAIAGEVTPYVARLDGSPMTARGVLAATMAAVRHLDQWDGLEVPLWVQGLGKVGMDVVRRLKGHPNLYVSDLRADRVTEAKALGAAELGETDRKFITVYLPCALGFVVTPGNVHTLTYSIICGAANNQLADDSYADVLRRGHVLYVPDFLANAGGVICSAYEAQEPYDQTACEAATDRLGDRVLEVLETAKHDGVAPLVAANRLAEARLY